MATGGIESIDPLTDLPGASSGTVVAKQAGNQLESIAVRAAQGDTSALQALPAAVAQARKRSQSEKKYLDEAWAVLTVALRGVLADGVLTEQDEAGIELLISALGVDFGELSHRNFELFEETVVARINDGRPPDAVKTPLITKAGETAYGTFAVALMKEVVDRELRGGSQGVSVHIAKGVNYRVGRMRGRSVVVGKHLEVQDSGILVVTDRRAVFMGTNKTLEFRRDRLVGLEEFTDGLRLSVSNRQTASLFRFAGNSSPRIAAAMLSHW